MRQFIKGILRFQFTKTGRWFVVAVLSVLALQPVLIVDAQTTAQTVVYRPVVLTSSNNNALFLQITAVNYSNGKWNYKVEWQRTLDLQGSLYVSPKLDKTSPVALSCGPLNGTTTSNPSATVSRIGMCTFALNSGTRYRLEFYQQPSAGGQLLLRKFFNTLDANGNALPNDKVVGGTDVNGNLITAINTTTGVVTTVTTSGQTITPTQTPALTASGDCPYAVGKMLYGCFVNVYKSNPPTGLAFPIEPQVVEVWNKETATKDTYNSTPPPVDPKTGQLVTNVNSSPCWNGTTDPKVTCDTTSRFANGDYQEVWVYATTGRPFTSSFYGPDCKSSNIKIEKTLNLPPGISYKDGCTADEGGGGNIILGFMGNSPSKSGVYQNDFKVTKTNSDGSKKVYNTRIYFKVIDHGSMDVEFLKTDGSNSITNTASLGSRLAITVGQTKNITTWTDIDFWAVPGAQDTSKNPEYFTNRILLGRYTVDEGWQGCNNSTAGGNDPYKFGCSRWGWLVGDTQGANLSTGPYTIYAATHLPYIDPKGINGEYIGRLYGNCEIGFTNTNGQGTSCNGFAWGGKVLSVTAAAPGESLPSQPTYNPSTANVASFGMFTINAVSEVKDYTGAVKNNYPKGYNVTIGPGQSNPNSTSGQCYGGNDTGGVTCIGPAQHQELTAGDTMTYTWSIKVPGQCQGTYTLTTQNAQTGGNNPGGTGVYWACLGGDGKQLGSSPPVLFSGNVDSTIYATGDVVSQYVGPTDTQASVVRRCTSAIIPGGFDYMPVQGFINSASGTYPVKAMDANCANAMKNVSIVQIVHIHIKSNTENGGDIRGDFMMGGFNYGPFNCDGMDVDICKVPGTNPLPTETGFFNNPAGRCVLPSNESLDAYLKLAAGEYPAELRSLALNNLLVVYNPNSGWKFDKAQVFVAENVNDAKNECTGASSGTCFMKDLGNDQSAAYLTPWNVAGFTSSANKLGSGGIINVSALEFSGLKPGTGYNIRMKFSCTGTNSGGVNYKDAYDFGATEGLGSGSSGGTTVTPTPTPTPTPNFFSVSGCYLPPSYQTDLNLSCTKTGSTANVKFNSIPAGWTYGSLGLFGDTLEKVESGCAGGTGHCSFENWNVSKTAGTGSGMNLTVPATITTPYWARLIFYCSADPKGYASVGTQCN